MSSFKYIIFCSDIPGDGKLSSRIAKFVTGVLMKKSHTVSVFGKSKLCLWEKFTIEVP